MMDWSLYSGSTDFVPVMNNCDITYIDWTNNAHCVGDGVTRLESDDSSRTELQMPTDAAHVPVPWKLLPASASEQSCGEQEHDVALLSSVLASVLDGRDGKERHNVSTMEHGGPTGGKGSRWWTQICALQLCPLSGFPIGMLPYPPFKFRMNPHRAVPHRLVDGKYLALLVISNGEVGVCGRGLESTDVEALDAYVHRCKLGPFRLGRALSLAREIKSCKGENRRMEAAQELNKLCKAARSELCRLQKIQRNRMLQMQQTAKPDSQKPS